MVTENESIRMSEELFERIEDQIDEDGWDFDCQFAGNALTIKAEDGTQIIVNHHTPNQELWITAKSGGYHFAEQNSKRLTTRDGRGLCDVLNEALSVASGEAIDITGLRSNP